MDRIDVGTGREAEGSPAQGGSEGATIGAGIAIGVSTYAHGKLTSCPAAKRTAEAVARALGPCLSNGVTTVIDPRETYQLFLALQQAAEKARGGVFVLYFAGITFRRDDELLLTTSASALDDKSTCIAWSDVDAILENERIPWAVAILNAEGFAGVGWLGSRLENVHGMGSVRIHDPLTAEKRIAEYGDAVADAFAKPAHDLRAWLSEGRLDVAALGRYLASRAPTPEGYEPLRPKRGEPPRHETFGSPGPIAVVLRDLRDELARPPKAPAATSSAMATGSRAGRARAIAVALLVVAAAASTLLWILLR